LETTEDKTVKKELNRKIKELCASAGTEAARDMAAELTADLDKRFDDRVAAGMSELDAYRDVLRNVDQIEAMLRALPSSDGAAAVAEDRSAGQRRLKFYLEKTSAVMWVTTAIVFFLFGLLGHAWKYAWLIFLWTTIGQILLDMAEKYNRKHNLSKTVQDGLSGILWVGTTILFFLTGFGMHLWRVNWLLFLVAVVVQILLDAILKQGDR